MADIDNAAESLRRERATSSSLPIPKGPIYKDFDHKCSLESRNGYIQAAFVAQRAQEWNDDSSFTADLLCELQRLAVNQIYRVRRALSRWRGRAWCRPQTPDHSEVRDLVESMCDYVNQNWSKTPIHLASYVMWRMNWIHPFYGGNGRAAVLRHTLSCAPDSGSSCLAANYTDTDR